MTSIKTDPQSSYAIDLVKLSIGDVSVVVYVIDLECESQLGFFVLVATELGHPGHELLEVQFPATIIVQYLCAVH